MTSPAPELEAQPLGASSEAATLAPPDVSIVVVVDRGVGEARASVEVRDTLTALARQDFDGRVEVLLCEGTETAVGADLAAEVTQALPDLRVVLAEGQSSAELKNAGVRDASADVVVILDADCEPQPGWLSSLMRAMRTNPRVEAVSGRTVYPGQGLSARIFGLIDRSFVDRVRPGPTRFVSPNNVAWRRSVYLAHPAPDGMRSWAAYRAQAESVWRAGGTFLFEPSMRVVHGFEGWSMQRDIRRNSGYATVMSRLYARSVPHAWLARLGAVSIPALVLVKTFDSWRDCLRCAPAYGVRPHEVPLALMCAALVRAMEVPGMWDAYRGRSLRDSTFR